MYLPREDPVAEHGASSPSPPATPRSHSFPNPSFHPIEPLQYHPWVILLLVLDRRQSRCSPPAGACALLSVAFGLVRFIVSFSTRELDHLLWYRPRRFDPTDGRELVTNRSGAVLAGSQRRPPSSRSSGDRKLVATRAPPQRTPPYPIHQATVA